MEETFSVSETESITQVVLAADNDDSADTNAPSKNDSGNKVRKMFVKTKENRASFTETLTTAPGRMNFRPAPKRFPSAQSLVWRKENEGFLREILRCVQDAGAIYTSCVHKWKIAFDLVYGGIAKDIRRPAGASRYLLFRTMVVNVWSMIEVDPTHIFYNIAMMQYSCYVQCKVFEQNMFAGIKYWVEPMNISQWEGCETKKTMGSKRPQDDWESYEPKKTTGYKKPQTILAPANIQNDCESYEPKKITGSKRPQTITAPANMRVEIQRKNYQPTNINSILQVSEKKKSIEALSDVSAEVVSSAPLVMYQKQNDSLVNDGYESDCMREEIQRKNYQPTNINSILQVSEKKKSIEALSDVSAEVVSSAPFVMYQKQNNSLVNDGYESDWSDGTLVI